MIAPHDDFDSKEVAVDALLEIFPQLESIDRFKARELQELVQYCIRVNSTNEQIRQWPEWLLSKWPMASATPKKFQETFHQMQRYGSLKESRRETAEEQRIRELANYLGYPAHTAAAADSLARGNGTQTERTADDGNGRARLDSAIVGDGLTRRSR